ncbi:GntR family transcriptional regulator [Pseudonocardia spinosispora]|uniref:GntR family transcriptional regulator n=1 Tax=Pseudonocardia spinosispora TaxID=103441 RepID=UPI00048F97B1|nr:GntR family transcriptional regulator [Pseudonocardia spinosispora]
MPARALRRDDPLPLWAQLQQDLRARLSQGEFEREFPGEMALRQEYGVSRNTVREALRSLRTEGVVTAARGRAPRVSEPAEIQQPLGALYSLFASVEASGLSQRSIVRTLDRRRDGVVAVRLGLEESTPLVHLERLRLAGPEPLALDRVWLPADLAEPLLGVDFTHTSLYGELAHRAGVRLEGGSETIHAAMPSALERSLLGCDPRTGAFLIERLGRTADRPVEWRQTIVRGDRFTFRAEFSARQGYQLAVAGVGRA